jgi:MFS-type transporter involved in bile tolerance (Atg22 family)
MSVGRGASLGCYLGVANALICGLGIALGLVGNSGIVAGDLTGMLAFALFLVVPGALFGLGLGLLAERLGDQPIWMRRIVLSCIPTLAGVWILERRTRPVAPMPEALAR